MARCCNTETGCGCTVIAGTGTSVSGDGSTGDPYVVTTDDAVELRGDVDPEGAVVGNPGDLYTSTDVAATLGRRLWVKATGTGNTGWVLVDGDTGWRDITSALLNGWTGVLAVRRTARTVEYRFFTADNTAATDNTIATVPTGFAVTGGATTLASAIGVFQSTSPYQNRTLVVTDASVTSPGTISASNASDWVGMVSGLAVDEWPAVLPGVALA